MKKAKLLLVAIAMIVSCGLSAQVAVTTDGSSADGSAMLEVKSTDKGFLPPRMTEAERNAINSPATGLIIYQTDVAAGLYQYTGTAWSYVGQRSGTQIGEMQYWNGTTWFTLFPGIDGQVLTFSNGVPTWSAHRVEGDVRNPITGKVWMDRNLGATQVATSSTDAASYGDLYQWGRCTDGHQIRTSGTTTTLSSGDVPGHGNFILVPNDPNDWRSPQNNNLWQGTDGVNNPCPTGYRLPTDVEWFLEHVYWSSYNAAGAFGSLLKLPAAGYRDYSDGSLNDVGSIGNYWCKTLDGTYSNFQYFDSSSTTVSRSNRANGYSVRCIKEY